MREIEEAKLAERSANIIHKQRTPPLKLKSETRGELEEEEENLFSTASSSAELCLHLYRLLVNGRQVRRSDSSNAQMAASSSSSDFVAASGYSCALLLR